MNYRAKYFKTPSHAPMWWEADRFRYRLDRAIEARPLVDWLRNQPIEFFELPTLGAVSPVRITSQGESRMVH